MMFASSLVIIVMILGWSLTITILFGHQKIIPPAVLPEGEFYSALRSSPQVPKAFGRPSSLDDSFTLQTMSSMYQSSHLWGK